MITSGKRYERGNDSGTCDRIHKHDAVRRAYFKGVTDTLTLNHLESENNGQEAAAGTLACAFGTPRCNEKGETQK